MTDHEKALRAAQDAVDAARTRLDGALGERRRAVLHARADKVSIYRIAQILGLAENAVRQDLGRSVSQGIVLLDPTPEDGGQP